MEPEDQRRARMRIVSDRDISRTVHDATLAAMEASARYGHPVTLDCSAAADVWGEIMRTRDAGREFPSSDRDMGRGACGQMTLREVCLAEHYEDRIARLEARIAEAERDAARYRYIRERDLETIKRGGIFAGRVPENVVVNGDDLDAAIDAAMDGNNGAQGSPPDASHWALP